jgi:hypothetical protein
MIYQQSAMRVGDAPRTYDFSGKINAYADQRLNTQLAEQKRQRLNQVAEAEIDEAAADNSAANTQINTAALARTRRAAGGTTFRRRGSAVSANQLVSGLGAANAKARADKRRAAIETDTSAQRGNLLEQNRMNQSMKFVNAMRTGDISQFYA